jgi:O-antigen/teichoic acid export membrane protein
MTGPAEDARRHDAAARVAARGVLASGGSNLVFLVSAFAVHLALPRLLESKHLYGVYGVVFSFVNVLVAVVFQGALQSVSKLVSEDESRASDVQRAALRIQLLVSGGLALACFLAADLIAYLQRDGSLAPYYRIAMLGVPFAALAAVFLGLLNGRKRFLTQAALDVGFAVLKAAFLLTPAAIGWSLTGVFGGLSAMAVVMAGVAAWVGARPGGSRSASMDRNLIQLMLPIMGYTLILNVVPVIDLWMLKFLGGTPDAIADYTAAQVVSRVPYIAALSIASVSFPFVSQAVAQGDAALASKSVSAALRYGLIVLGGCAAVLAAAANEVIVIPYPESFRSAGALLVWLAVDMVFFGLFSIAASILTASGRARLVLWLGLAVAGFQLLACAILIPHFGGVGAAAATGLALFFGSIVGLQATHAVFRGGIRWPCALRVSSASAVVIATAFAFETASLFASIGKCIILGAVYLTALVVTGELRADDWHRARATFRRS